MFMCHDYLPEGRTEYQWETTIGEQKKHNIHLKEGTDPDRFKNLRDTRDAALGMPKLIIPSIQVNMHGGTVPKDTSTGDMILKTPVNSIFSKRI
jgi:hypothetical protein